MATPRVFPTLASLPATGIPQLAYVTETAGLYYWGGGAWQAAGAASAPEAPVGGVTIEEVIDILYPVGALYTSTLATNPATLLGRGTWVVFGAGRVMVGRDAADPAFDTAEETGGAKTHTLLIAEMPAHTHVQTQHNHTVTDPGHTHLTQRYPTATGGSSGFTIDTSMSGALADNTLPTKTATTGLTVNNATPVNQDTGGGGAHNNLQPYIVVYAWKRTA